MALYQAALLDLLVISTCVLVLIKHGRMTAFHPATMYCLFHFSVVTVRILSVLNGSPTLFAGWRGGLPVADSELAWAANLADCALVSMTAAWVLAARNDRRRQKSAMSALSSGQTAAVLSERVIWIVSAIAAPIGIVALIYFGN